MTGSATNDGSFMGHAPTGRAMRVDVFGALRVEGDRIVEHWGSRAASAPSPSSASRTRPAAPAAA